MAGSASAGRIVGGALGIFLVTTVGPAAAGTDDMLAAQRLVHAVIEEGAQAIAEARDASTDDLAIGE